MSGYRPRIPAELACGQRAYTATVKDVRVADVEVDTTNGALTAALGHHVRRAARLVRTPAVRRFALRRPAAVPPTGKSTLGIARRNGSVEHLAAGGVTLPTALGLGQVIRVAIQVTGTSPVTIRARVWVGGASKPGWQT